jgi:hypothetical protein
MDCHSRHQRLEQEDWLWMAGLRVVRWAWAMPQLEA